MKRNQYYNKKTMNYRQLARDLEKQGFTCKLWEDRNCLIVNYLCYLDCVVISLTDYKEWLVTYCRPFHESKNYKASTNWSVIKLLRRLLIDAK